MNSVILKAATRLLSGSVLVLSIYLLWRGHHLPGGGFIAGLVAATGFALMILSEGPGMIRNSLPIRPQQMMGLGILFALAAGLVGIVYDRPFLTGIWWPRHTAIIGTPLIFDLGVFILVVGAILTILVALEEDAHDR